MRLLLRILHFSPSTATGRHDSHRASLLFLRFVREAAGESGAAIDCELNWALPSIASKEMAQSLMTGADLLVLSTPTYAQGSPWFVRRFLELGAGLQLWGTLGTAFATAGGTHTGGDVAVADTLRSLHGMGMLTLTFAQKYVVFGAQQKLAQDGEFDLVDAWFLRQLARVCIAQLLGARSIAPARVWAERFQLNTGYYNRFPKLHELQSQVGEAVRRINLPLAEGVNAYDWWSSALEIDAAPPDAAQLPFYSLLPLPVERPPGPG